MKKVVIVFILLFVPNFCSAVNIDIREYIDKEYIGMSYNTALNQEKPFLLLFGNPKDAMSALKLVPIAEVIYNEYKNDFNFCILNTNKNKTLVEYFGVKKTPAVFIIDTNKMTYARIQRRYHNKKDIRKILSKTLEKQKTENNLN